MTQIMQDLIERLEKATGHDDDLNDAIAVSQGWKPHRTVIDGEAFTAKWTTPSGETRILCPWYISSIDAALTLVPEGAAFGLVDNPDDEKGRYRVTLMMPLSAGTDKRLDQCVYAVTLAIALCVAALRAKAAVEGDK